MVRRQRGMTALEEKLGDPLVQSHAFSLGKARVDDLLERGVPDPPPLQLTRLRVAHNDFQVFELLQLFGRRIRIHDGELSEVERVLEDRGVPGELAQPGRHRVESRAHHGLHRGRDRAAAVAVGPDARGHQHAGGLDDEVGIASGPLCDLQRLDVADAPASGVPGELDRLIT